MENIGAGVVLGLVIGILSGIFGVSGGVFAVPLLGLLHFDEHRAQEQAWSCNFRSASLGKRKSVKVVVCSDCTGEK